MQYLNKGKYYGVPQKVLNYKDLIITDNEYIHSRVDWHYHENVYFTYLLSGRLKEISRTGTYDCIPGTLLFHNRQEPHYNIKPPGYTRGFQVECTKEWFKKHNLDHTKLEGSGILTNPLIKNHFNRIYTESVINDDSAMISIEGMLLVLFGGLLKYREYENKIAPVWIRKIVSILHECFSQKVTLEMLSEETGIHPVHISRMFTKYSGATIGSYIRSIRVTKSIEYISGSDHSLTEISNICGFSDQSHFIRAFRELQGITPSRFRRSLHKR